MGRRSDIDWEKIQKLYIANQMTMREIAAECGVSVQSIVKKAKKDGWQRNLDAAIKERTKAKLSAIDVQELIEKSATESAQKSAQTLKSAIEMAADNAANVRIQQRAQVKLEQENALSLQYILDAEMSNLEGIGDVLKATQAYKNLVEIKLKLQERADNIFGLKEDDSSKDDGPTEIVVNLVEYDGKSNG